MPEFVRANVAKLDRMLKLTDMKMSMGHRAFQCSYHRSLLCVSGIVLTDRGASLVLDGSHHGFVFSGAFNFQCLRAFVEAVPFIKGVVMLANHPSERRWELMVCVPDLVDASRTMDSAELASFVSRAATGLAVDVDEVLSALRCST